MCTNVSNFPGSPCQRAALANAFGASLRRVRLGLGLRSNDPARRAEKGLTAIELLVVLAVIAILAAVAIPSFVDLTQRNRVSGEVNGFVGDLQFARSEAIKEGQTVTICASANGSTCASGGNWRTGWLVFADTNSNQVRDSTETVLRKQPAWAGTDTFTASNNTSAISYSRDGFAMSSTGTVTLTVHTTPLNAAATRCIAVNLVGRQQVQTANGGTCQ